MSKIEIITVRKADQSLIEPIKRLLAQLTSKESEFSISDLSAIVGDPNSRLFTIVVDGVVAGMLTLGMYSAPTGRKIWIEDVVVDSAFRGRGLGRMLIDHSIEYSASMTPCSLMLTSRPSRIEANELYRKAGFEQRQTNVYKMDFCKK